MHPNFLMSFVRAFFPVGRRILLPLLLEMYVSIILLFDAQRHHASTGCYFALSYVLGRLLYYPLLRSFIRLT